MSTVLDRPRATPSTTPTLRPARTPSRNLALAVIVTCQLMLILDATVVNIALPTIQGALHFSATNLSWVLNAYTLAFGGLLLLGGRAGDILGRRRVFMGGLLLFTGASLLGGFATSAGWLLATRAAQGVGAAFAGPSALALIATTFAEGPERNRALGLYSAVSSAGGSLGLLLGGLLTSWVSWRWVLFINVPIGLVAVALAPLVIAAPERQSGRLDPAGALTATAGMAALVYGFIRAASDGWSDHLTLGAIGAGVALLAAFVIVESRMDQPIMPLRLFANRNRASAYLNILLLPATLFSVFYFLTQFLQDVRGFSPLTAGLAFLPLTLALFAAARIVPRLLQRVSAKPIMVFGAALIVVALAWFTQVSASSGYVTSLLGPMLLLGIGGGCSFMPLAMTILSGVPRHESGAASGLLQTMQQVGATLGLSILVTIFGTATRAASAHPLARVAAQVHVHDALAHGIDSAFNVATLFAACVFVVALVAIRATPPMQASR